MDGGRVARAIAWWGTGDRNSATRFAADLGRIFGYLFIAGGICLVADRRPLRRHLAGADRDDDQRRRPGRRDADRDHQPDRRRSGRRRDGPRTGHDPRRHRVEQALDEYFLRYRWPWFPVVDAAHRFLGLLERDAADEVPEVSRAGSNVSEIVDADRGLFIRDDTPLDSLLANQNLRRFGALMAVDADGRLCGVITVEQVGRALRDATSGRLSRGAAPYALGRPLGGHTKSCRDRCQATARWRVDDAPEVGAGGEGAEGLAPVAGEAGGAEGVGDGFVAVADQERGLEGEGHALDHAAGAGLDRLDVAGEFVAQGGGEGGEAGLGERRPRRPRRRRPRARPGS